MIYITGDTHRKFTRFRTKSFPEQRNLTKEDYVIICGDFGIWNTSDEERYWLDWLNDRSFTTLFVDGNHENFDLLNTFPIEIWNGGKVQFIRSSIIHLMRGQVFNIEGKRFFTMGGASSHDIDAGILEPDDPDLKEKRLWMDMRCMLYRINHVSWWKEELPSDEEYEEAWRNLDACGWKVDYVVSHCCPSSIADVIGKGHYSHDRLTDFFEELKVKLDFQYWFFGHYHDNRELFRKYVLLYEKIVSLETLSANNLHPSLKHIK